MTVQQDAVPVTVAVLFDIDGTLLISGGAGAVSWRRAFDDLYHVDADINAYSDTGMTDPEVGRLTFEAVLKRSPTPEEFEALLSRREHHLHDSVKESEGYRVLDGVEDLLLRLLSDGYLLGLVTGNLETSAHIKLHRGGLNRFFSFGGYGSDSPDRAEIARTAVQRASLVNGAPVAAAQCLVVGDTPLDVNAAHAAGIRCVGVASHKFDEAALLEAGADVVLASLTEPFPIEGPRP